MLLAKKKTIYLPLGAIFFSYLLFKFFPILFLLPLQLIYRLCGPKTFVYSCLTFIFLVIVFEYYNFFSEPIYYFNFFIHDYTLFTDLIQEKSYLTLYLFYIALISLLIFTFLLFNVLASYKIRLIFRLTLSSLVGGILFISLLEIFYWLSLYSDLRIQFGLIIQSFFDQFRFFQLFLSGDMNFYYFFEHFQTYLNNQIIQYYMVYIFLVFWLTYELSILLTQPQSILLYFRIHNFRLPKLFSFFFIIPWLILLILLVLHTFSILDLRYWVDNITPYSMLFSLVINWAYLALILYGGQGFSFLTYLLYHVFQFSKKACFFIQIIIVFFLIIDVTRVETIMFISLVGLFSSCLEWGQVKKKGK